MTQGYLTITGYWLMDDLFRAGFVFELTCAVMARVSVGWNWHRGC